MLSLELLVSVGVLGVSPLEVGLGEGGVLRLGVVAALGARPLRQRVEEGLCRHLGGERGSVEGVGGLLGPQGPRGQEGAHASPPSSRSPHLGVPTLGNGTAPGCRGWVPSTGVACGPHGPPPCLPEPLSLSACHPITPGPPNA